MKKVFVLVSLILILFKLTYATNAGYPKICTLELATSVYCSYCPDAYAGIEKVKLQFNSTEFIPLRYYVKFGSSTTQPFVTSETQATGNYIASPSTGLPTANIGGTNLVVGGGSSVASGSSYIPIVGNITNTLSPLNIIINNFSAEQTFATVNYTIESIPNYQINNLKAYILLVEDNVIYSSHDYDDIVRRIKIKDFTQTGSFQDTLNITTTGVNLTNLKAVILVRNNTTKEVIQAATSLPKPTHYFRSFAADKFAVKNLGEAHQFGDVTIFNVGSNADTYNISINNDNLPSDWVGFFCDENNCYPINASVTLQPGESKSYHVTITSGTTIASGISNLSISSVNTTKTKNYKHTLITNGVDLLLVDDDGAEQYENYYINAFPSNYTFGVINYSEDKILQEELNTFDAVVWNVGWSFPTLTAEDRELLTNYLNNNGKLFISGQDIGWALCDLANSPEASSDAVNFYHNYLHANFINDDTNILSILGVSGDIIGNGLSFSIQGGDGANNQSYPSEIAPYDENAVGFLKYNTTGTKYAAVRAETNTHRVVYLAFGFEAISTLEKRKELMKKSLDWLITGQVGIDNNEQNTTKNYSYNYPNPFNPTTTIKYSLNTSDNHILFEIYNTSGQRVFQNVLNSPNGKIIWNGCDNLGNTLGTGIYFYKIFDSHKNELSGKMLLVK